MLLLYFYDRVFAYFKCILNLLHTCLIGYHCKCFCGNQKHVTSVCSVFYMVKYFLLFKSYTHRQVLIKTVLVVAIPFCNGTETVVMIQTFLHKTTGNGTNSHTCAIICTSTQMVLLILLSRLSKIAQTHTFSFSFFLSPSSKH